MYKIFRILLYPFLAYLLPLCSTKMKARLSFEKKNQNQKMPQIIFHVSSEGELEQSLALIDHYLSLGKRTLILFTSPSVEKKVAQLKELYQNLLLTEALPVLTYLPFSKTDVDRYSDIEKFFMVRYDFFPELINFSYAHDSVLLNATLINKNSKVGIEKYILKRSLNSFNQIVLASKTEEDTFLSFGVDRPFLAFDMRSIRILERLKLKDTTLRQKINHFDQLESFLSKEESTNIMLGSFWSDELDYLKPAILKSIERGDNVFIAPHDFKDLSIGLELFKKLGIRTILLEADSDFSELPTENAVYVLMIKGILCEMYSYFDHVYVAGGYHKSIHSVLEPFLAGAGYISCGKNISRSTEFNLVRELDEDRIRNYNESIDSFKMNDSTAKLNVTKFYSEFEDMKKFITGES